MKLERNILLYQRRISAFVLFTYEFYIRKFNYSRHDQIPTNKSIRLHIRIHVKDVPLIDISWDDLQRSMYYIQLVSADK